MRDIEAALRRLADYRKEMGEELLRESAVKKALERSGRLEEAQETWRLLAMLQPLRWWLRDNGISELNFDMWLDRPFKGAQ